MTSKLKAIVDLYRVCDRPELTYSNTRFSADVKSTEEKHIESFKELKNTFPELVKELFVDGDEIINIESPLPTNASNLKFIIQIPQDGTVHFYLNSKNMLEDLPSLLHGELPDEFYLVEENYFHSNQTDTPQTIKVLISIVRFICFLKKIADRKSEHNDTLSLMYLTADDSPLPRMAEITIQVKADILNCLEPVSLDLFTNILANQNVTDVHKKERQGIFINTLAEFIASNAENTF